MDVLILLLASIALSNAAPVRETCEKFVKLPVKTEKQSVADSLCKGFHSFKSSASFDGVIDIQDDQNAPSDESLEYIVGSVYQSSGYTWSDGTPISDSFWAVGEPHSKSQDAVVLWHRHSNDRNNFSNVLSTASAKDLAQKPVLCKVGRKCDPSNVANDISVTELPSHSTKAVTDLNISTNLTTATLSPKDLEALNHTECDAGWERQVLCGKVNCYKKISIRGDTKSHDSYVENDICAKKQPGSHLVSIHCTEEYEFLRNKPHYILTGFYIPQSKRVKFDPANFQWTDGSPVDYVNWVTRYHDCVGKPHPLLPGTKVCDGTVVNRAYLGYKDDMNNIHGGIKRAFCKKPATVK